MFKKLGLRYHQFNSSQVPKFNKRDLNLKKLVQQHKGKLQQTMLLRNLKTSK